MKLIEVESSNLAAVGYDPDTSVLRIRFKNGWVYDYYAVPSYEHQLLMAAESKGKYFAEHIKPVYHVRRVQ